jgi:hypothetical protein
MLLLNKLENEARVVPSAIVSAATGKAGRFASEPPDAWEFTRAAAATIQQSPGPMTNWKGKRMAARFATDPKIMTRRAPLGPVGLNPAASCARVSQQMREFVSQRPVDFSAAVFAQPRIQRDAAPAPICPAGSRLQPGFPADRYSLSQGNGAGRSQNRSRLLLDRHLGRGRRSDIGEIKRELFRRQHTSDALHRSP